MKPRFWNFLIGLLLVVLGTWSQIQGNSSKQISEEGLNELFHQVLYHVKTDYVEKIKRKEIWFGAINGMLKALGDEHSRFMTPTEFNELKSITKGSFGGLGIEITIRDKVLTIVSPIEDTPAMRAGLQPGDKIVEIDKKPTRDMSLDEAVKLMRGSPGTAINISVAREGEDELLSFEIIRDVIKIKIVRSTIIKPEKIGYVRLKQFSQSAYTEIKSRIRDFERKKVTGIILDLRYNAGGLLDSAHKISNLFLSKGIIVSTKGRKSQYDRVYRADPKYSVSVKTPLVILVNEGSASASEIVTGAVKDNKRGKVVGVKTFGKGSVQNVIPLSHNTAIALTIQKYYTPSGKSIHKLGIEPDIKVKNPEFTKRDRRSYREIKERKLVESFVSKNAKYSKKNMRKFQKMLKKENLDFSDFAAAYTLKQYINRKETNLPVFDLEFDTQLKRAIKIIKKG